MMRMAYKPAFTASLPKRHILVTLFRYTFAHKGFIMKSINSCSAAAIILLSSVGSSFASSPGTTAADLLNIGVGARAIGMGEAFVAQADDSSSLYWNPAGLALETNREAAFAYNDLDQNMTIQHGRLGLPL